MNKKWGRVWFELRDELGQSDIVTMMYKDGLEKDFVAAHFPHRDSDGFGRIQKILQSQGINLQVKSQALVPPAAWKNLFLTIKGIFIHPKVGKNPWKIFIPRNSDPPDRVSFRTLSYEQNEVLKVKSKNLGVSPAFYLLTLLSDEVRSELFVDPKDKGYWLFPVNLRGAFPAEPLDSLCISFLPVEIAGGAMSNVTNNYNLFRKHLKKERYWAFFALYNIGNWIGRRGMKFLVNRNHNRSFWLGSFSDLGSWNQADLQNSKLKDRTWVIAPPGSPSYPVGFTTIEWCGSRTMTLRIHPSITNKETLELANSLLNKIMDDLSKENSI